MKNIYKILLILVIISAFFSGISGVIICNFVFRMIQNEQVNLNDFLVKLIYSINLSISYIVLFLSLLVIINTLKKIRINLEKEISNEKN